MNYFIYTSHQKIFSDKVHAILIEGDTVQTTLRDGASFRRLFSKYNYRTKIFTSAFKFRAKYSHINL